MPDLSNITTLMALFEKWKKEQREEQEPHSYYSSDIPPDAFFEDGIVNEEAFKNSNPKILFIAKELNAFSPTDSNISDSVKNKENENATKGDNFWLKKLLSNTGSATRYSRGLAMIANAMFSEKFDTPEYCHKCLSSVATINLNKRGGTNRCNWKTLEAYTERYADYIAREIEIINPEIIICCGVYVKEYLFDKYISPKLRKQFKVISISHPSRIGKSTEEYLNEVHIEYKKVMRQ